MRLEGIGAALKTGKQALPYRICGARLRRLCRNVEIGYALAASD
jgi:hypothetical protein